MDSPLAQLLLGLFTFGGWLLAAGLAGLYVGERGRRRDAQRREGVIEVDPVKPATVREPDSMVSASVVIATEEARDRYVDDAMREGFTRSQAEADWEEMMRDAQTDRMGG